MSPDAIPMQVALLVAAGLWLIVWRSGMRAQRSDHRVLDHEVQPAEQHEQAEQPRAEVADKVPTIDIHARIVSCPCLNRSELRSGFKCEHTR